MFYQGWGVPLASPLYLLVVLVAFLCALVQVREMEATVPKRIVVAAVQSFSHV